MNSNKWSDMKKSNLLFTVLAVTLYAIPLIGGLIAISLPPTNCVTGFNNNLRVIQIDNAELAASDVHISKYKASAYPTGYTFDVEAAINHSYIYYKGKETYFPNMTSTSATLYVTTPKGAGRDRPDLHIRVNGIRSIILNGNIIWNRD